MTFLFDDSARSLRASSSYSRISVGQLEDEKLKYHVCSHKTGEAITIYQYWYCFGIIEEYTEYSLQDWLTIQGQVIFDHLVRHLFWHPSVRKLMRWQGHGGKSGAIDIRAVARPVRKRLG